MKSRGTLLAIFALALAMAACQTQNAEEVETGPAEALASTTEVTPENILGLWGGEVLLTLNDDGTFKVNPAFGPLRNQIQDTGRYELEGSLITFISAEDAEACPGIVGSYETGFSAEGELVFTLLEDECAYRMRDATAKPFVLMRGGVNWLRVRIS